LIPREDQAGVVLPKANCSRLLHKQGFFLKIRLDWEIVLDLFIADFFLLFRVLLIVDWSFWW
jgi:hypothetical protein